MQFLIHAKLLNDLHQSRFFEFIILIPQFMLRECFIVTQDSDLNRAKVLDPEEKFSNMTFQLDHFRFDPSLKDSQMNDTLTDFLNHLGIDQHDTLQRNINFSISEDGKILFSENNDVNYHIKINRQKRL